MEKNLGHATAYGYAKSKGYSGTEDEFAQLMADYASVGQSAAQSAEQAAASATSASGSAATATQAAQTATDKTSEAVTAADTATTKASEASTSADTASAAATSAITSAQTATTAAATATTKASEAAVSANTATTAKTDAESARDAAAQSASQAAESARTLTIDVGGLKEDLSDISATVETLISKELTLSVGLMNKYGTASSATMYENGSLQVSPQERYQIDAFYYGGNFPAVVFFSGASVVSFINGTGDRTEYADTVTVPNNADTMVINGRIADIRAKASKVLENKVLKIQSGSAVDVGKDASRYEYTDINTAIVNNADSVVLVDYGTYETEIQNLTTNKRIIGKDVDLCILNGTNKDYDTPPIEIAGGIVKNFTVNMINAESASHKGYCLHSDNVATVDNTLHVENCKFKCIGQHAIGIGVRSGETVVFENCYFEQLDNAVDTNPVYLHNSTGANPSVVRFHNCYFRGYAYCMKLQAWGSGNNVQFEFINCTCLSDTYGVTDECVWTDYVSGSTHDTNRLHEFSGKFTLLPTSHGNNIAVLNSILT